MILEFWITYDAEGDFGVSNSSDDDAASSYIDNIGGSCVTKTIKVEMTLPDLEPQVVRIKQPDIKEIPIEVESVVIQHT